jgi:phthiodiolone/phenolphthiodiolone dimycocerosates ketoreductase
LQHVQAAADNANRDPRSIIAASWQFVVTGRSKAEVEDALESVPIRAFTLNLPAWAWAEHGVRHPMGDDSTGFQDLLPQTLDEQTALAHAAAAPMSALKQYVLTGTPDEVIDQLAAYRDHGVRYPVLCNISVVQAKLSRGLAATLLS